jgi:hypothetical protein
MKKKTPFLFIFILIVLLAASCQPKAGVATPLSAALSELSGRVDTKLVGDETFAPASADTILEVNGQIQTGDDGRVRLDLSTGTIIRVAPSSLFTLTSNDEVEGGLATKLRLDIGKIFIILNGGRADVETPSGVASVRGSYMKVEVDPETLDIYVTCLEGDCSASNPAGTVNFTDGQKVILFHRDPVTGNWTAPNAEPMTPEEFQEWLDENPEARELFEQAMATVTALALPSPTATQIITATPTIQAAAGPPADSSGTCFKTIQPSSGASLPKQGPVDFGWESQPGAQQYVVTFIDQNGYRVTIPTTSTSATWYIELFPTGGEYSWFVTSYGTDGSEICSTSSASFSKPQGEPTPKPTKEKELEPEPEPEPTIKPEKTKVPTVCAPADYCDEASSCYDFEYCIECIDGDIDYCEEYYQSCAPADYCDPQNEFCYYPGAECP